MKLSEEIAQFLAPNQSVAGIDFCLPKFSGSESNALRLASARGDEFRYPSVALAERDARSAMHVISLLGCAPDISRDVQFHGPEAFKVQGQDNRVRVLFGSRSNQALPWIIEEGGLGDLVRFEFGVQWTIIGQDRLTFSIPDPSKRNRQEYSSSIDYGVVARVTNREKGSTFLLAGLGGRATEGAGLFLRERWHELQNRFGNTDFAVVLEFPPPVDPQRCEAIAWYRR